MPLLSGFHHASLLTEDLAAARAFYEGVLELPINHTRPALAYDGIWYNIGAQQIHLIALPNPDAGAQRPPHGGRDRHIALTVGDWDGLLERLQQAGVKYTLSATGRKAIFCRDPDDNALELMG
jgi:catechol 2,3-dioxygenase-like lactoylglutathione lyase family enzyme